MGVTYIWNLDHNAWDWVYHYLEAGDVVYDVGANAGQPTGHLAQPVGPTGKGDRLRANVAGVPQRRGMGRDGTGERPRLGTLCISQGVRSD
jgi:hypothetical protein